MENRLQGAKDRNGEFVQKLKKQCKQEIMVALASMEAVQLVRNAQILDIF